MAQQRRSDQGQQPPEKPASIERGRSAAPVRQEYEQYRGHPFDFMRRVSREMDRVFGDFFGPGLFSSTAPSRFGELTTWWPDIEVLRRGNRLVVRADVPGLKQEDVNVEVRDSDLCISGERRSEAESTEGGYYRSERSYGSFCRVVPLPEGAKPETASATFENGVLEIEVEVPSLEGKPGRRIEVREKATH